MATVTRYVDTASSGGDGTTENHSGATAAYASLSSWESSEQTDLVTAGDVHVVNCAGSTADSSAVTIDGWTTGASNTITVQANRSAADSDGFYTGPDLISTSHYRIENSTFTTLVVRDNYVTVDGLQVYLNMNTSTRQGIRMVGTAIKVYRCRVLSSQTSASNQNGIGTDNVNRGNVDNEIDSNIIVNFTHGVYLQISNNGSTRYVRNNTIYGSATKGIDLVANNTNILYEVKNNVVHTTAIAGGDYDTTAGSGTPTVTTDTNAFEDSESTTNEVSLSGIAAADIWTSPGTGLSADFSLLNNSACTNTGISTGETTDAYDVTRTSPYDIGAVDNAFIAGGVPLLPLLGAGV